MKLGKETEFTRGERARPRGRGAGNEIGKPRCRGERVKVELSLCFRLSFLPDSSFLFFPLFPVPE